MRNTKPPDQSDTCLVEAVVSLLQNWVEVYRQQAPWDSAVPGHSSLDVGVRRVLRAECFQIKNKPFASIFIDISGFYDNVQWSDIARDGLELQYPPLILELCLQVYAGGRILQAEQVVSPTLYPRSGLLQGCPCAPSICKIALHQPQPQHAYPGCRREPI